MAHHKAGSTANTNRDSQSKRLGLKHFGEESVKIGNIIVRQKGNHFYPGSGTRQGHDFTIYSITEGKVKFAVRKGRQIVEVNG
ncbi:MAG: 50S ribosomal protein L27 [Candidatus Daviesbacteria bacterium]